MTELSYQDNVIDFMSVDTWAKGHQIGEPLLLKTDRGGIPCLLHSFGDRAMAVVWAWGVVGGFEGPANGVYERLAERLTSLDIDSLRINYRSPGDLVECILDVLVSIEFLVSEGYTNICLVGHSFGGAVVISAGAMVTEVKSVIALSSQTLGADRPDLLFPRPLLLIHGMNDRNLSHRCSEIIYEAALHPKQLRLLPETGHGLRQSAEEVEGLIWDFVTQQAKLN